MQMKTIAALAMAISFSAQAEWTKFGESDDGAITYYLDYATIKKTQHGYRVWELRDYSTSNKDGELSAAGLEEYDCKDERSRPLQVANFYGHMGKGEIGSSYDSSYDGMAPWKYPMPGSAAETLLKEVCRAGK